MASHTHLQRPQRIGLLPLLVIGALALIVAHFAWVIFGALDTFADYHAYYRAAANLRSGSDIYAEGKLLVARNSYDFWTQTDGQYVYPPALALAFLPLTLVNIGQGGAVWLMGLILGTIAFCWLAARLCGRAVGWRSFLAVALPVAGIMPLALGVRYGLVALAPLGLAALALGGFLLFATRACRSDRASRLAAAALVICGGLAFLLGLRVGEIDRFLLVLALPGLCGTLALAWWGGRLTSWTQVRGDFGALLPLALPIFGATPLLLGLQYGQSDLALLLLTTGSLLAHRRRRDLLAGVALGVAAAIKPTLALYGLFYLRKRCWTTLITAAITGALVGFAPFLFLGGGAMGDWLTISRYFGAGDYLAYPTNASLRGVLLRAFVGGPQHPALFVSQALAMGLWILLAGAAVIAWWRRVSARRETANATLEWSLTAAVILFAAPLSEDIHFVALLLPLAFLADRIARGEATARWRALALAACLVFVLPLVDLGERLGGGELARLFTSAIYLCGLIGVGLALGTGPRVAAARVRVASPTVVTIARPERAALGNRPAYRATE